MRFRAVPAIALGAVSAIAVLFFAEKFFDPNPGVVSRRARVAQFDPITKLKSNSERVRRGAKLPITSLLDQQIVETQTRKIEGKKSKAPFAAPLVFTLQTERAHCIPIIERGSFSALMGFRSRPYRGPPILIS